MGWNTKTVAWSAVIAALGASLAWSCGGGGTADADGDNPNGKGGTSSGGGNGDAASQNNGGQSSSTAGNGSSNGGRGNQSEDAGLPDVDFGFDASPDEGLNADSACGDEKVVAERKFVDMYVILDRSGSMREPLYRYNDPGGDCNVGAPIIDTKWCKAVNALGQYFQSDEAEGNRAAFQLFSSELSSECGGSYYSEPLVDLTDLGPTTSTPLITGLNDGVIGGGTPTEAALRGMMTWTTANADADPNRVMVGILITDGEPQTCQSDDDVLASIIRLNRTVPIYIVGMDGASDSRLETLAAAGGAELHEDNISAGLQNTCGDIDGPCYHWSVGDGDPDAFAAALAAIQGQAAGCEFAIPEVQGTPDWDTVTVEYLPGGDPPAVTPQRVSGEGACGSTEGWHFDDNDAPTEIRLCPTLCETVQDDPDAEINVLLGCLSS